MKNMKITKENETKKVSEMTASEIVTWLKEMEKKAPPLRGHVARS